MVPQRRQSRSDPAVVGPARVDARTKRLTRRLQPGDIAVIDHEDLDRVSAEGLVQRGVGAVVNAAHSISGRRTRTQRGSTVPVFKSRLIVASLSSTRSCPSSSVVRWMAWS